MQNTLRDFAVGTAWGLLFERFRPLKGARLSDENNSADYDNSSDDYDDNNYKLFSAIAVDGSTMRILG